MLMSGNSGASAASTAPIVNEPGATVELMSAGLLGGTGIEHQPELADLDLVTSLQCGLVDPFPVDVGAVQRTDVAHQEDIALAAKGRMLARDRHVVKEDVTLGMATRADFVRVEQETCTGVRAAKDYQQRRAGTQCLNSGLVLSGQGGVCGGVGIRQRLDRSPDARQAHRGGIEHWPLFLLGLVVGHDLCAYFRRMFNPPRHQPRSKAGDFTWLLRTIAHQDPAEAPR